MDEKSCSDPAATKAPVRKGHRCWFFTGPFLFLACYILSTGPALKFIELHPSMDFSQVYMPILWLEDHSEICSGFFTWYIHTVWAVGVPGGGSY